MNTITVKKPTFYTQALYVVVILCGWLLEPTASAQYSVNDAETMMNSFNNAFLQTTGGNSVFPEGFWQEVEMIEGVEDAYESTGNPAYLTEVTQLLNGFTGINGTSWSGNGYNDDCMWACIAYLRGYGDTGNASFLSIAESNFGMVWARAWDTSAGGLWWTTADTSKNSCDENPAAIAAYLLYQNTGNSSYLTQANELYNWEVATLFNPSTGEIYDNYSGGTVNGGATSYNQGTFIGASDFLGHYANAEIAANYLMGSGGLLPDYGLGNNNSGFNGIAIRWTAKFMKDYNLENNYLAWLQFNANAAFQDRRSADDLSWCSWEYPTPASTLDSWSCISSIIALMDVPPTFPYTFAAAENGTVNFTVPVDVAFGANGNYFYEFTTSDIVTYTNSWFGDPAYGVSKAGYYAPFTVCAWENQSKTFNIPVEVAYGTNGHFFYNYCTSGTVTFNDATFGDPDYGVAKAGFYMPYTVCAVELQTNTFTYPVDAAYGVNGHFNFLTNVSGTIVFNDTTFGDPAFGQQKYGYYRRVNLPPALGIANPAFALPNVGSGGSQYNPTGGSWTFSGDSGVQANGSSWGAPPAPSGNQTAFLQVYNGGNNGTFSQTVTLPAAGTYTLSLYAALRGAPFNNGAIPLNVLVNGTVVGNFSPTSTTSFTLYTATFPISTAGSYTIQLAAAGTASDSTIFVSSVGIGGLANLSFETPYVGAGGWFGYEYNTPAASWSFGSSSGIACNGSALGAPTPPDGSQYAFIQVLYGGNNGVISQTGFFSAGTFSLSFDSALRSSNVGSISLNVLLDNSVVGSFSPVNTSSWTNYSVPLNISASGNHTVQFVAVGNSATNATIFIDAVSIQ